MIEYTVWHIVYTHMADPLINCSLQRHTESKCCLHLHLHVFFQVVKDEYDEREAVWLKKYSETLSVCKKVHAEISAHLEQRHDELRKKAYGKHMHLHGSGEKANTMMIEGGISSFFLFPKSQISSDPVKSKAQTHHSDMSVCLLFLVSGPTVRNCVCFTSLLQHQNSCTQRQ